MPTWKVDRTQILTIDEILTVVADLRRRAKRSPGTLQQLALFHLATSYGLRAGEIVLLRIRDICFAGSPHINTPTLKQRQGRRRRRRVPLDWTPGASDDLALWQDHRLLCDALPSDPYLCTLKKARPDGARTAIFPPRRFDAYNGPGRPLDRRDLWRRYKLACRILGPARVASLTIHHGRHSFITYALAAGHTPPEVRDAAGHASLAITDVYAHVLPDTTHPVSNVYYFDP